MECHDSDYRMCTQVSFRLGLFTRSGLDRKHLRQKLKARVCKWCAQSKITKRSFGVKEHVRARKYLEQVTADIAVYFNCPSMEDYRYVLTFIDAVTNFFWSYLYVYRDESSVLLCFEDLVKTHQGARIFIQACQGLPGVYQGDMDTYWTMLQYRTLWQCYFYSAMHDELNL